MEIARRIAGLGPQLDTKLAPLLRGQNASDDRASARFTGSGLQRRPHRAGAGSFDAQPQSEAARQARLTDRTARNSGLVEACLAHEDARVRANAVESFWGDNTVTVRRSLQSAANDSNNRVAGNALRGLYRLRDREAVERILAMGADSRPLLRATAASTMGQTSDPVFLPILEKLKRDLYALVRKNAAKAVTIIRDNSESPASQS